MNWKRKLVFAGAALLAAFSSFEFHEARQAHKQLQQAQQVVQADRFLMSAHFIADHHHLHLPDESYPAPKEGFVAAGPPPYIGFCVCIHDSEEDSSLVVEACEAKRDCDLQDLRECTRKSAPAKCYRLEDVEFDGFEFPPLASEDAGHPARIQ
jgi:hypothetical protein